jgi:hypothetical protein
MVEPAKTEKVSSSLRPKISDIKLPILKPECYSEWKIKITSLLKAKELYDLVENEPTPEDVSEDDWDQINEEAKSIIYSTLDGKTTQAAGICSNAYELWKKVTGSFEGVKDDLTGLALSRFMEIAKSKQETLGDFLDRYEIALNNLKATTLVVHITIAIYVLCKSLPQNIKEGVRVWRTVNPEGTLDQLISYIRANYREEDAQQDANDVAFFGSSNNRRNNFNTKQGSSYPYKKGNNYRGGNNKYRGGNNNHQAGNNKGADKNLECTYCKKKGHNWRQCYKLENDNARKTNNQKEQAHMALEMSYQAYQQSNIYPKERETGGSSTPVRHHT